jgi:hypothetical protein
MIRRQVNLPIEIYQGVQWVARKENKPTAKVIRELLTQSLTQRMKTMNAGARLLRLAQRAVPGLPADLSVKIDDHLYAA